MGNFRVRWVPGREVKGIAYDTPIVGYKVNTCNTLRLWKAEAVASFEFKEFNVGDYYGAVQEKIISETITKVLISQRRAGNGQEAQTRPAILFRLLFPSGHAAHSQVDGRDSGNFSQRNSPFN